MYNTTPRTRVRQDNGVTSGMLVRTGQKILEYSYKAASWCLHTYLAPSHSPCPSCSLSLLKLEALKISDPTPTPEAAQS